MNLFEFVNTRLYENLNLETAAWLIESCTEEFGLPFERIEGLPSTYTKFPFTTLKYIYGFDNILLCLGEKDWEKKPCFLVTKGFDKPFCRGFYSLKTYLLFREIFFSCLLSFGELRDGRGYSCVFIVDLTDVRRWDILIYLRVIGGGIKEFTLPLVQGGKVCITPSSWRQFLSQVNSYVSYVLL